MAVVLSVVVPVYNVRPFLEKCVESLLTQDLAPEAYEIILVDDGSTDGGGELCDRLRERRDTIRVIHQSNQGLSAARNTGLGVARGKYVQFVDSDDWIESGVLKGLVDKMEAEELDVLRFGFRRVDESGGVVDWKNPIGNDGCDQVRSGNSFLLNYLWFSCYAWQFMLRRSFLERNDLRFKPGIIFEDTEWTPRVLQAAGRVCGVETLVYHYLERTGSITKGKVQKRIEGQLLLVDEMKSQMRQVDDKRWYRGMIAHQVVTIVSSLAVELFQERKPYLRELKRKKVLPLVPYQATRKARRKAALISLSPSLACRLIHFTQ